MKLRDIAELAGRRFDLLVVGGGVAGAGIARDAALRGLSCLLVEKEDWGGATSSASSKLAHGGLRYLEHHRFSLVRESLQEREILLRTASHLVRPLPFLLPFYRDAGRPPWMVRLGLTLYDLLAGRGGLGRHRGLDAAAVRAAEPDLQSEGLRGGALFQDAQMNDARLVLENVLDAREQGARCLSRVTCADLLVADGRVTGARLRDGLDGSEVNVEADLVVNAAGPWYARVLGMQSLSHAPAPRLSRGVHLATPALTRGHALLLQARQDRRVFFVLPWKGGSLVGTTETPFEGDPDALAPGEEEIDYLLRELQAAFPSTAPTRADVRAVQAGLRTLPPGSDEELGEITREAQVREEAPGLLCVLGGKYTTYRAVAERTVDLALTLLRRTAAPCVTATRPLPGGDIPAMNDYFQMAERLLLEETGMPVELLRHILGTHGSRHGRILQLVTENPAWGEPLEEGLPFTFAEVICAVRDEDALSLDDLVWRRTWRAFRGPLDEAATDRWEQARREGLRRRPRQILV
jgi:glycerol-3-phosphate dehydrogenase